MTKRIKGLDEYSHMLCSLRSTGVGPMVCISGSVCKVYAALGESYWHSK